MEENDAVQEIALAAAAFITLLCYFTRWDMCNSNEYYHECGTLAFAMPVAPATCVSLADYIPAEEILPKNDEDVYHSIILLTPSSQLLQVREQC